MYSGAPGCCTAGSSCAQSAGSVGTSCCVCSALQRGAARSGSGATVPRMARSVAAATTRRVLDIPMDVRGSFTLDPPGVSAGCAAITPPAGRDGQAARPWNGPSPAAPSRGRVELAAQDLQERRLRERGLDDERRLLGAHLLGVGLRGGALAGQ